MSLAFDLARFRVCWVQSCFISHNLFCRLAQLMDDDTLENKMTEQWEQRPHSSYFVDASSPFFKVGRGSPGRDLVEPNIH